MHQQKVQLKKQLKQTKHEAGVVTQDIVKVNDEIDTVEEALSDTSDQLVHAKHSAAIAQSTLAETTKKVAASKLQVQLRLKHMYIKGDASVLTAFMGASSVGDVASRKFLFERIAAKDHEIFDNYRRLREEEARRKKNADDQVAKVAQLEKKQKAYEGNLESAKQRKQQYLGQLKERADELQQAIRQFDADEASIGAQIRAYEAAARRPRVAKKGPHGTVIESIPAFNGRFGKPINARMTSRFGMRFHPILHRMRMHTGLDFGAPVGSGIHAAADGVVIAAQVMRGYGNVVMVDHGGGVSTVYAHCSRFYVGRGTKVKRGQVIAAVGNTGLSTGPHLHFEIRINGHPVNPLGRI